MPGFVVFGLSLAVAAPALLLAWQARRRLAAAEAAAEAQRRLAAARDRTLSQLTQEMQSLGLALLGHAGRAMPAAEAIATAAEARRLLHLADELTEFLAAQSGPRLLRPERVALLPVLEEAVAATDALLGPAGRRRHWQLSPDFAGLVLHADARALRGALQHVLSRAARMTRDGDWIGLRPVLTADGFAIVVEDEGAGLPAEDVAATRALAPEAPSAERTRGLGFGLAVARALVEAHGGSLRIETAQGVGARTWLTLPRDRVVTTAAAAAPVAKQAA